MSQNRAIASPVALPPGLYNIIDSADSVSKVISNATGTVLNANTTGDPTGKDPNQKWLITGAGNIISMSTAAALTPPSSATLPTSIMCAIPAASSQVNGTDGAPYNWVLTNVQVVGSYWTGNIMTCDGTNLYWASSDVNANIILKNTPYTWQFKLPGSL
ncbi:hypothetical protein B0H34DRAFT_812064 [Crassisporium funariophilum]|nr:hypothetical protein B0H34DRAFT_812063 [Crassisporium funariophilum]KAF8148287.1 hypothetical protein B0H34DRAFT_812064 [Crassisporium funariophilum]